MAGKTGLFVALDGSGNGADATGARLALGGMLAHNGASPLDVRTGVLVDGGGPVVSGTGGMAYSVRAFVGVTLATITNGPVVAANDAPLTIATDPAPGSNARVDVVWARQKLIAGDGGAELTNEFEFGVTVGDVDASPVAPAIPAGALSLASALVTAGATSTASLTFTRTHDWTVANGGIIPDDAGDLYFNGSLWVPVDGGDTGWLPIPLTAPWAGATAKYRVKGGECFLQGSAVRGSGTSTAVGTMPAGARPSITQSVMTRTANTSITFGYNAAGALIVGSAYANGDPLYFDNINFLVN